MGYVYSVAFGISMVMPFLSRRFTHIKPKNLMSVFALLQMLILLSLLLVSESMVFIAVLIFVLSYAIFPLKDPVIRAYFHKFVPSRMRATVVSTKAMMTRLVIVIASVIAGILMDIFGPQIVIGLSGLFGIVAIIFYQKIED